MPSASRQRSRAARRFSSIAAALFVVAGIVLAPTGAATAAAATTPSPSPTDSTWETVEPDVVVSALVGTSGVLRAGDALRATVTLSNLADERVAPGTAVIAVGTTPFADLAAADAWLTTAASGVMTVLGTIATPAVDPSQTVTATFTAAATNATIAALTPGTYAIEVSHAVGTQVAHTRTLMTVRAAGASAPVVSLLPILAPIGDQILLSAEELERLTAPDGALSARLDAVISADIVLAIDPAIPAAIRALGTSAPQSAVAWLERLEALGNERIALPFADADLATQADAGVSAFLEPGSLGAFLRPGDFPAEDTEATPTPAASATPAATPSATATDGEDPATVLPTTAELTDVSPTLTDVVWPRTGTVTEALFALAADETILIGSEQLTEHQGAHARIGTTTVFAYDEAASAALADAAAADATDRPTEIARVAAAAAFATAASAGAPTLLVVDRALEDVREDSVHAALVAVRAIAGSFSSWETLRAGSAASADLIAASPTDTHAAAVASLVQSEAPVATLASVLTEPDLLIGRERARLLQLLSASAIADPGWVARADAFREATASVLGAVRIVPRENLNIVSRGVNIPVWISNDLPFTVNVDLVATPADVRLDVQRVTPVVAEPQSTTRVMIPVTSGVSNGDVILHLGLRSPTGASIGAAESTQVTVRADWEQIGLVILAVVVVLLFAFGTVRTIRSRRRGGEATVSRADAKAAARAAFRGEVSREAPETPATEGDARG